jgi:hypothetical protein
MILSTSLVAVWYSSDWASFFRPSLLRLKQPRVLDGYHRLIGEGFQKLDLTFGERPSFRAADPDSPDRIPVTQERNGHEAP